VASPRAAVGGGSLAWRLKIWGSSGTVAVISPTKP
jgi:hypothetical protein